MAGEFSDPTRAGGEVARDGDEAGGQQAGTVREGGLRSAPHQHCGYQVGLLSFISSNLTIPIQQCWYQSDNNFSQFNPRETLLARH